MWGQYSEHAVVQQLVPVTQNLSCASQRGQQEPPHVPKDEGPAEDKLEAVQGNLDVVCRKQNSAFQNTQSCCHLQSSGGQEGRAD